MPDRTYFRLLVLLLLIGVSNLDGNDGPVVIVFSDAKTTILTMVVAVRVRKLRKTRVPRKWSYLLPQAISFFQVDQNIVYLQVSRPQAVLLVSLYFTRDKYRIDETKNARVWISRSGGRMIEGGIRLVLRAYCEVLDISVQHPTRIKTLERTGFR